ncbi:hypothetical protein ACT7UA_001590 [Vibrio cholerae]|nr:hypothetical protein [Vibrio cholerae]
MKVLQRTCNYIRSNLNQSIPRLNVAHIRNVKNERPISIAVNAEANFFKGVSILNKPRTRVSNMRQLLPLESFELISKAYESKDIRLVARDSAFLGLQRAVRSERFELDNFKSKFPYLTVANGSLRIIVTGLKGIVEFDDGQMKDFAKEILDTQICGVPFSQFGTCSGSARDLVANASYQQEKIIIKHLNELFEKVALHLVGAEV